MNSGANTATQKAIAGLARSKYGYFQKGINSVKSIDENAQAKINLFGVKAEANKKKVSDNLLIDTNKLHEKADLTRKFHDAKAEKNNQDANQTTGKINQYSHEPGDALNTSPDHFKKIGSTKAAYVLKAGIKQKPEKKQSWWVRSAYPSAF